MVAGLQTGLHPWAPVKGNKVSESTVKPRVALLGLGIMGSGMAGRLLFANFPLTVYNRNAEKTKPFISAGATAANSPREAASEPKLSSAWLRMTMPPALFG